MDSFKKNIKDAVKYLLVWFCSGAAFYAYQTEHMEIGVFFTLLSFLYWLL